MKKNLAYLVLVGASLAAMFGLTACVPVVEDTPTVTTQQPETVEPEPDVEREPPVEEESAPREDIAQFGKSGYTYDNGVTVAISKGEAYSPSEYAAAEDAPHYLRFTVTLSNDGDTTFDPSMFMTFLSSGGVEHSEVFDDGVGEVPSVPLRPGKSVSFDIAYPVEDVNDLVMSVSLDWDNAEVLFTS